MATTRDGQRNSHRVTIAITAPVNGVHWKRKENLRGEEKNQTKQLPTKWRRKVVREGRDVDSGEGLKITEHKKRKTSTTSVPSTRQHIETAQLHLTKPK